MSDIKRTLFRAALLAAIALASVATADAQSWKKSTWSDFGFSASFPGSPTLDSTSVAMGDGERRISIVGTTTKKGYFSVMVTEMPEFTAEKIADATARGQILDGAQRQALEDAGATARSQRELTLSGRHGREIISVMPDKTEVHARIYLDASRMYMLIAVVEAPNKALATRFLDGFRLL